MCCRDAVLASRRRWKPRRRHGDFSSVTGATTNRPNTSPHTGTVDAPYVLLPTKHLTTNQTAHRTPLSRPKAVINVVRSSGDRNSGRGGVLSIAGLPGRSHPRGSVQSLVDGMLITVLGIFVVVVVAAVTLARRRRRAIAASHSRDDYDIDDGDNCVELGEFVTDLDDSSHDDDAETTQRGISSPVAWSMEEEEEEDREEKGQVLGDVTSLTPLCGRSTSSAASSVASGSTLSDTPLYWHSSSMTRDHCYSPTVKYEY